MKKIVGKLLFKMLKVFYKPEEIVTLSNSDINWGEGYDKFFVDALRKLDEKSLTKIPKKWKYSPKGDYYKTVVEFMEI